MSRHSSVVGDAILKLFSVLSTWQHTGHLILVLNAFSPSDSEHWFPNHHFGLEYEDHHQQQQEAIAKWHDPNHGWINGASRSRLFSPLCSSLPENIPQVHVVKGLVIRRQLRRRISPETLRFFLVRLPKLESIVYEPWRAWRRSWKAMHDEELASVIQDALPSHVRTVSIFEDFNDHLALALRRDPLYLGLIDTSPIVSPMLVRAFASKSHNFAHLSISYMIDAQQFFDYCHPSYVWRHLQSLTLTSSILTQTAPHKEITAFLHNVSSSALNMPQLESLVFWNNNHREACAVIYRRNMAARQATLTWRGTWDLEFSHDVVESWQKVASDSCALQIKSERVYGVINSRGDAICHLRLPSGVIDPLSPWQIRQEGIMQRMA